MHSCIVAERYQQTSLPYTCSGESKYIWKVMTVYHRRHHSSRHTRSIWKRTVLTGLYRGCAVQASVPYAHVLKAKFLSSGKSNNRYHNLGHSITSSHRHKRIVRTRSKSGALTKKKTMMLSLLTWKRMWNPTQPTREKTSGKLSTMRIAWLTGYSK